MSSGTLRQDFHWEDLLEVMVELLTDQSASVVNSSPTATDFPQLGKQVSFTEQEMTQLKNAIAELETKEQEVISHDRDETAVNCSDVEKLQETIKQEIKEEVRGELREELNIEGAEKNIETTESKDKAKKFKQELVDYSLKYAPTKITIESGQQISGVLCEVEADFIVVINRNNQFIKIPLSKIIAVKKVSDLEDDKQQTQVQTKVKEKTGDQAAEEVPLPAPEKLLTRELVKVENKSK